MIYYVLKPFTYNDKTYSRGSVFEAEKLGMPKVKIQNRLDMRIIIEETKLTEQEKAKLVKEAKTTPPTQSPQGEHKPQPVGNDVLENSNLFSNVGGKKAKK